jgi:hypothetical protein
VLALLAIASLWKPSLGKDWNECSSNDKLVGACCMAEAPEMRPVSESKVWREVMVLENDARES